MMERIRKPHAKTRQELKELLIALSRQYTYKPTISWNEFAFEAKALGTTVRGEILDSEILLEISGLLAKRVIHQVHEGWDDLAAQGLV